MTGRNPVQMRAEHALRAIEDLLNSGDTRSKEVREAYRTSVQSVPATILMNGLGQAIAGLMAQAGKGRTGGTEADDRQTKAKAEACRAIVSHLESWLCEAYDSSPYHNGKFQNDSALQLVQDQPGLGLMKRLTDGGQSEYIAAQAEAFAYLDWLKKFANALLVEYKAVSGQGESEQ